MRGDVQLTCQPWGIWSMMAANTQSHQQEPWGHEVGLEAMWMPTKEELAMCCQPSPSWGLYMVRVRGEKWEREESKAYQIGVEMWGWETRLPTSGIRASSVAFLMYVVYYNRFFLWGGHNTAWVFFVFFRVMNSLYSLYWMEISNRSGIEKKKRRRWQRASGFLW